MPAKPFAVRLNLDEISRNELAAALHRPAADGSDTEHPAAAGSAHHGARDERQAARERSGRARAGRAAGASGGRSYAFRRS
ncbi:hypothetical protein [Actinoplanes aureus]|jgi:hypothetical protein|uniref:Uncharacterized protein n=1 Tax=Actinoplanes aureus TaxID=2792083 RepID=A0A931G6S1_9ACTN|nr:hypothetical protein [Actinoplanes aureus]MBG0567509.1 hypothetical protein [Actinoplanes aureus]